MNQKFTSAVLVLIILTLVLLLILKSGNKPVSETAKEIELKRLYDSSQLHINRMNDSIALYENQIKSLSDSGAKLIEQYKNKQNEINKLKTELSKKNNAVDRLNCFELQSALTIRYDSTFKR